VAAKFELTKHVRSRTLLAKMLTITATTLKNQLGKFMRLVQSGKEVVITDRDRPVAKLIPVNPEPREALRIRHADPSATVFGLVTIQPLRLSGIDSLSLLMEDRASR